MKYTILSLMFSVWMMSSAQAEFITTWDTTSYPTIDLPIDPNYSGQYNYDVDIDDDGVYDFTGITGPFQHTFPSAGTHTIRIIGDYPNTYLIDSAAAQNEQLTSVNQWGAIEWKSMNGAFSGVNTDFIATDVPDLSQVTDMSYMFANSAINNLDVSRWDVSSVTNMRSMFSGADFADPDVSNWDVSSVTNMDSMFAAAFLANPDVSNWDVSSVISMGSMFAAAFLANPDVSNWDVSSVTNMSSMFNTANVANPNVSNWDVSSVANMGFMFNGTNVANPDVSNWNVSSVNNMRYMFNAAANANPDLSNWDVSSVTDMDQMFDNSGLSTRHYDDMLDNFAGQTVMENVTFSAGTTPYCSGGPSKDTLINGKNWIITDGGVECIYHDVSIEVSNQVIDGDNPQVTILVKNNSILVLNDVEVMVDLDMNAATNISWTCDHGGSSCGGTSGSVLDTIPSIPPNTAVTYTVNFDALIGDGEYLNISGSAVLLSASEDFPADNTFDKYIQIIYPPIFANGFE